METLLTRHGDNRVTLWGGVVSTDAGRLADTQLAVYLAVTAGWIAHAVRWPPGTPLPEYPQMFLGRVRLVLQDEDQAVANRALAAVAVATSRALIAVGLLGGCPPIPVVSATVVTTLLVAVPGAQALGAKET